MSQPQIISKIIKTELISWSTLKFVQDDNFKEWVGNGDKKLMESILKYQFIDPFKVYEENGVLYCLDGKHRFLDLKKAIEEEFGNVEEAVNLYN